MQEFIQQRGVTKCPSFGTKEFAVMNIEREKARSEEGQRLAGRWVRKRKDAIRRGMRQPA